MKKEARFWETSENNSVQCLLCHQNCKIKNKQLGICGVRKNENGKLYTMIYGSSSSIAVDPIEKKPFYHFHPGTSALSLGTVGCNFKCLHCQNSSISRATTDFEHIQNINAEEIANLAKERGCQGVAWTYNEPTIWHEFTFDSSKLVKKAGLYVVYVSNGYIQEEPLRELSSCLDAINIDIKAFTDSFYKKVCKARLQPVLETCVIAKELGIHVELTYLIIPGYNDSKDEIKNFCDWVVEKMGNNTAVHFSRFHPDYKMNNVDRTPMEKMKQAYEIASKSGLLYAYLGNVPQGDYENTICPKCGSVCIDRHGYLIDLKNFDDGMCLNCKTHLPIQV